MQDLASSLGLLKSRNILHRDLKPDNFLLTQSPTGQVILKLADFGFAKQLSKFDELLPSMVGTPVYLAPEIWRRLPYTTKSDLWSVGVIFFEMLVGSTVFYSQTIQDLQKLVAEKDVRIPTFLQNTCTPLCLDLLKGLLQKDPDRRLSWDEFLGHPWLDLQSRSYHTETCDAMDHQIQDLLATLPPDFLPTVNASITPTQGPSSLGIQMKAIAYLAQEVGAAEPLSGLALYMEAVRKLNEHFQNGKVVHKFRKFGYDVPYIPLPDVFNKPSDDETHQLFDLCFHHAQHISVSFPSATRLPSALKVLYTSAMAIKTNQASFTVDLRLACVLFEYLISEAMAENDKAVLFLHVSELNQMMRS